MKRPALQGRRGRQSWSRVGLCVLGVLVEPSISGSPALQAAQGRSFPWPMVLLVSFAVPVTPG